jgi:hypothetical protein
MVGGPCQASAALPPEGDPVPFVIGVWAGRSVGLDGCSKILLPSPGIDPRTVQPVVSRFQAPEE